MIKNVANFLAGRGEGYIISGGLFTGCIGYTVMQGPKQENDLVRLGLAGTSATVITEVLMHVVDTINMRSKVLPKH